MADHDPAPDAEDAPQEPAEPNDERLDASAPRTPGGIPVARAALLIALAVSLLFNVTVSQRIRDAQSETAAARAQVRALSKEIDTLRGALRSTEGGPFASLQTVVSKLRHLRFTAAVEPELLTTAQLADRVRQELEKESPRADVDASDAVLTTLGLLPDAVDLYELLIKLQTEQVAGFYDPTSKKLVVRSSEAKDPSPLDRILLAHELTHAVTDQHFDLGRIETLQDADKDDAATAFTALAEGDAQFTMALYQREVLTPKEQTELIEEASSLTQNQLDAAPRFLREALEFPYVAGLDFVETLHERGGFDLVDRAYEDPPRSTEQILHPARYLDRRDDPQRVSLPNIAGALGSGWSSIERGELGELDVRLIADLAGEQGLPAAEARRAADGWDGGTYEGFRSGTATVVAFKTVWDSDAEVREAVRGFERWLPLRYRNEGSRFTAGAGAAGFAGKNGAGIVARQGRGLVVVLGPSQQVVSDAFRAF